MFACGFMIRYDITLLDILFDLILYVLSTISQLCRNGSFGLNQYKARINMPLLRARQSHLYTYEGHFESS